MRHNNVQYHSITHTWPMLSTEDSITCTWPMLSSEDSITHTHMAYAIF